ncbi:MarR family winged helix-turn-helix transcriptional regulator [Oceanobacter sp. 3_MG-2023]|uniref:MarR family winged helix-turn-helix transcriptional regulator n=1 Tax=Oceanobacter sp. 3_MG-2023 TaxID=3062622 RepID=UPI00273752E9|nr:MarR family transcriptional regulator [Oceanobacter sp. 3_MG-2023]MDP2506846.1 MarR family transcriptional regulator [Oceanobacter sp. 3_MG-2023]
MSHPDHVDFIASQWATEKPDLDTGPMQLMGRFYRLSHLLRQEINDSHKQSGLNAGEFDVLATLLRSGEPWTLTPTKLFQSAMLTSGAMTNRLNRLEKAKLIQRLPSEQDRRSLLVQLTEQGKIVTEKALKGHDATMKRLTGLLQEDEQQQLNALLRQWLACYQQTQKSPDRQAEPGQLPEAGEQSENVVEP